MQLKVYRTFRLFRIFAFFAPSVKLFDIAKKVQVLKISSWKTRKIKKRSYKLSGVCKLFKWQNLIQKRKIRKNVGSWGEFNPGLHRLRSVLCD